MDYTAVCLLLSFACIAFGNSNPSPLLTPEMVQEINSMNVGYGGTLFSLIHLLRVIYIYSMI